MTFFKNAAKYYQGEPHQDRAWDLLEEKLPKYLLEEFKAAYRNSSKQTPSPSVDVANSWEGIYAAAEECGAKYPECVAAQWALESAFGQHTSGKNNFFGIKGKGTVKTTWEDYGYGPVTIKAEFKDYDTPKDCVEDLVSKWYRDYKSYKGVNRASNRNECARLLKAEGYATDPIYASKLIQIMDRYA